MRNASKKTNRQFAQHDKKRDSEGSKNDEKQKNKKMLEKRLDKTKQLWYHIQVGMERWLSWSKAHDWKSCLG